MKVSGLLVVIVTCLVGMVVCRNFVPLNNYFPPPPPPPPQRRPRPTNDGLFGLAALFGGKIGLLIFLLSFRRVVDIVVPPTDAMTVIAPDPMGPPGVGGGGK